MNAPQVFMKWGSLFELHINIIYLSPRYVEQTVCTA